MDKSKESLTPAPPGWRIDPRYIECRTKRAPLMMPPSVHARIKAVAEATGVSFNSWCLTVLERGLQEAEQAQEAEVASAETGAGSEGEAAGGEAPAGAAESYSGPDI